MSTYFSGTDQFEIIFREKRCNSCIVLKNDFVFEDCVLDWDIALYSTYIHGGKSWFIKGIVTGNLPIQLYPSEKNSRFGTSKGVISGHTVYILDQASSSLYSLSLSRAFEDDSPKLQDITMEKFIYDQGEEPKIIDISSSGKECFAIDSVGGVYVIPKLLCRMEGINWTHISSGFAFNLILTDTGAVYSWGNGSRGELGQRNLKLTCEFPSRIDFFDDLPSVVISIACGGWHSLALTSEGDLYTWGWNESGQLGHSENKLSAVSVDPYPVDLGSAEDPVKKIAAGARHSIAILKSSKLFSWGSNKFGQLGLGDCDNRAVPTELSIRNLKNVSVQQVQCGRCATIIRTR